MQPLATCHPTTMKICTFHKLAIMLVCVLLSFVRADGNENKERKGQVMSTGETAYQYIERKIKTHEVSIAWRAGFRKKCGIFSLTILFELGMEGDGFC